jgi:dipeptidyl aminopeptidase/acylaminoacyl peptidase
MQELDTKIKETNYNFPNSLDTEVNSNEKFVKMLKLLFTCLFGISNMIILLLSAASWIALNPAKQPNIAIPSEYGLDYKNVTFYSEMDRTRLEGWWIPSQSNKSSKTVIFSHGYGDSRTKMPFDSLSLAKALSLHGYNILMYDFRNSGSSGGKMSTAGYLEQRDLKAAIDVVKRKGTESIALLGWSMGAATSILVGAEDESVKAIIADSSYADFSNYIQNKFSYWMDLPKEFAPLMLKSASVISGMEPEELSPVESVKGMDKGLLLIHGIYDGAINIKQSQTLFEAANKETTLFWKTKAGHMRSYRWFEETYEQNVLTFLKKYM